MEEIKAVEKEKTYRLPKAWMQSHFVIIFLLFAGGALAVFLDQLTGINASLWALVIGVTGAAFRFLPEKSMEKANSSGITMIALIFVVINSLIGVTWDEIVASLLPVTVIMVIGIIGLILGAIIGAKVFKWDKNKSIPVVLTALYGFPGDYLIVEEISRSEGRNEAEQKRIMDELMAPMLIGGFTSVTVGSVAIASILISTL
ncbi:integral membrane protein [Bacillus sp. JCM 19045]|nr:integral membrane protein [Bacillus sp. JCM 19045]